ncbi:ABC transporter permease [Campylobacter sp. RM9333]|uniref:ABC transporter permease n=1 Tax=Campylobacter sp. RM9333 TaxID=2735731 RepID=UPI001D477D66|nr:ABC transporter permease [Campylobacter sp. RM9333]
MIRYLLFKYLRFDKSMPFIMITKLLAFIGVALGVCVLIITMAVMNGMNKSFIDKLLTMNYPITLYPKTTLIDEELINELSKNYKISPFIQTQAAIKYGNEMRGAIIFGIDFEKEKEVNKIFKDYYLNSNLKFPAILGNLLASRLEVNKEDKIHIIFTNLNANAFSITPNIKSFYVNNTFHSGLNAYDSSYVYVDIKDLQKVLKNNEITGIHIDTANPKEEIKKLNEKYKNNYFLVGWWEQNGNILSAIDLEKKALFFILMMIVIIASLNIITSLFMIVLNRRNEIALLLALGTSKSEIQKSFFTIGCFIGFIGIIFGCLLGFFGLWFLDTFDIISLPADVYGSSKLPINLSISDFCFIILGASLIVVLSSLYPAYKASKIDVLKTLRNE